MALIITVSGPDKSGKGHIMALVAKALRDAGAEVSVQAETTHNATKMQKPVEELHQKLTGKKIMLLEQQTA